jgi:hypothetical protein
MAKVSASTLSQSGGVLCAWLTVVFAGCASPGNLPLGTSIESVRDGLLAPTDEYALPDGRRRLEFRRGSLGRETWMLDFDANGALVSSQQVLTQANFADITPGMSADDVRMRLGHPSAVFGAGWQDHLHVWNYRFAGGDCVWFQVSIRDADRTVSAANIGMDPVCDGPNTKH